MAKHHKPRPEAFTALDRVEAASASPAFKALRAVTAWAGGGRLISTDGELLPEQVEALAGALAPSGSHFAAADADPTIETAVAVRWAVMAGLVDSYGAVLQASDAGRRMADEPMPAWEAAFSSLMSEGILTTELGVASPWAVTVDRAVVPMLAYLYGLAAAAKPEVVLTTMCRAVAEEAAGDPDLSFILDLEDWVEGAATAGGEALWWLGDLGLVTLRPLCGLTPLGRWAVGIVLRAAGLLPPE